MKINPKVTVLMSVYNGERYLRQAIDSILNQTFKDFEFIIINDCSTDNTSNILNSYDDPRIKIIINDQNIGLTKSLNKGIEIANGEYIARQDADDISYPHRIERQIKCFEKDRLLGLLSCSYNIIDENGRVIRKVRVPIGEENILGLILDHNPFCHGSAMFLKKAVVEVGGYREFFIFAQDYDLWLRISEKYKVKNIDDILYNLRKNKDSISSRKRIEQCQYAMVAIRQSMKRKKNLNGDDEIGKGLNPELPKINQLTKGLKKDLINYHFFNIKDSIKLRRFKECVIEIINYLKIIVKLFLG